MGRSLHNADHSWDSVSTDYVYAAYAARVLGVDKKKLLRRCRDNGVSVFRGPGKKAYVSLSGAASALAGEDYETTWSPHLCVSRFRDKNRYEYDEDNPWFEGVVRAYEDYPQG